MEYFDHLKIRMDDIICATGNFGLDKLIGRGGFGPVYRGELSLPTGPTMVAFKRLDARLGQGNTEFWKEITMLSECKHENLVSLMNFCIQGDERVLVYEYASRGSLDRYISDVSLTWNQRLEICIQVARALKYLHDPDKAQGTVLHRDIKSSNILLDDKWTPKVSDFGLSKIAPTNQLYSVVVSNFVGTVGYCDPMYWDSGILSEESDIYSFGVVLFELMSGRLCTEYYNGNLSNVWVSWWKRCCDENKLDDVIFPDLFFFETTNEDPDLKPEIEWDSLITFSTLANRCTNRDRKERPTINEILEKLQVAHEQQNINSKIALTEISELAVPPLCYTSPKERILLFSKGILVDEGKRWIRINKNKLLHEMVSATECVHGGRFVRRMDQNSRFSNIYISFSSDFKVEARTQFLSPHVTYIINLVFKHEFNKYGIYVPFIYKLEEETHYSKSHIVQLREDGWLTAELYRFTSYKKEQEFKIEFLEFAITSRWRHLEGIEFQPMEHETNEDRNDKHMLQISSFDNDFEQNLTLYRELSKLSTEQLEWATKKELYFLLREGFSIENGEKWLSISKKTKKRLMISSRSIVLSSYWIWTSLPESRFEIVSKSTDEDTFTIDFQIKSESLSLDTIYTCHLIYILPEQYSLREDFITIQGTGSSNFVQSFYLVPAPPSPIIRSMVDEKYDMPSHTRKIKGRPKLRKDGWMDLTLCEISTNNTEDIEMHLEFRGSKATRFAGLVIEGIEFKPL